MINNRGDGVIGIFIWTLIVLLNSHATSFAKHSQGVILISNRLEVKDYKLSLDHRSGAEVHGAFCDDGSRK